MDEEKTGTEANCAACPLRRQPDRRCVNPEGKNPPDCPTVLQAGLSREVLSEYGGEETHRMAVTAAQVEAAGYARTADGLSKPVRPRIVELVDFARRMGYAKIGLHFCIGLRKEASIVREILEINGFCVVSAVCKVGCVAKSEIGIERKDQLADKEHESMCNPILQAELANEAGVSFNVLLGLCVGHDTLLLQHLRAPATTLAVKDRLMGHNPLAALYTYDSYSSYLKRPLRF